MIYKNRTPIGRIIFAVCAGALILSGFVYMSIRHDRLHTLARPAILKEHIDSRLQNGTLRSNTPEYNHLIEQYLNSKMKANALLEKEAQRDRR